MSPAPTDLVLAALARREPVELPVAMVVAHPDDETVGAGGSLHLFRRLLLVHVTDGAPRGMGDARAAGFATHTAYAQARRRELDAALAAGRVRARRVMLPVADQGASLQLGELAATLTPLLADAAVVLTHAYEGGHPDHDAVAFAVQASGRPRIEMAGYHAAPNGHMVAGHFLDDARASVAAAIVAALDHGERARRDEMLECFATQRLTLQPFFGWTQERFRAAPSYDFTRPPAARAYYDGFDWGMDSRRWCALAAGVGPC